MVQTTNSRITEMALKTHGNGVLTFTSTQDVMVCEVEQ
jgi:hypothetical protein